MRLGRIQTEFAISLRRLGMQWTSTHPRPPFFFQKSQYFPKNHGEKPILNYKSDPFPPLSNFPKKLRKSVGQAVPKMNIGLCSRQTGESFPPRCEEIPDCGSTLVCLFGLWPHENMFFTQVNSKCLCSGMWGPYGLQIIDTLKVKWL